ncbi:MAG: iron ABC transporter permease [Clostridiales bacterium]|nr:iron ABC transporter permease [Clostridiales bacterium]
MRGTSYIHRRGQVVGACLLLAALSVAALFLCCAVGSARVAPSDLLETALAKLRGAPAPNPTAELILFGIRLPRALLSYAVGAALAVSGALMQGVFRNPMAEPGLLGVSSGAALGAAVAMVLNLQLSALGFSAVSLSAFAGGTLAVLLVLGISRAGRESATVLLLSGVAVSAFLSAVIAGLLALNHDKMDTVYLWTMGSFASASFPKLRPVAAATALGLAASLCVARDLNALSADADARTLGVNAPVVRLFALGVATLLTAAAVSVSGVIGFVGLMAPHAVRSLTGADHRSLLPLSALAGGLFLLAADTLARTLFMPAELPVGAMTSLFGGPFFLLLIRRAREGRR